jgi:hypothetical protein
MAKIGIKLKQRAVMEILFAEGEKLTCIRERLLLVCGEVTTVH